MFKGYGLASPLLDSESLGDKIPETLAHDKDRGPASGISGASYSVGTKETFQVSLNELGVNAWWRPAFQLKGKFETWIEPKLKQPCVCLLVAGHHSLLNDWPVVWGQEDRRKKNRFFTALLPEKSNDNKPILKIEGNPYQSGRKAVLRAGPFNFHDTLSTCGLVVVMGCNGIDFRPADTEKPGHRWQRWVELASGKKPVVLGWYGVHAMPRDTENESFSQAFWREMEKLAGDNNTDLSGLCEAHAKKVIEAWGAILKETYGKSKFQRHLWYDNGVGAGAIDPEGNVWKVTDPNGSIKVVS